MNPEKHEKILHRLITESRKAESLVRNLAALLEEGCTVPFIARYRKERTGGMDEVEIRTLKDRLESLTELEERKETVLRAIEAQGKLTDELQKAVEECYEASHLEDLYLPYKPKRKTKASIARERGLLPLAETILQQDRQLKPLTELAKTYVDSQKGVASTDDALEGASFIIAEQIAEGAEVRAYARQQFNRMGVLRSKVIDPEKEGAEKFRDYFQFEEPVTRIPSHRILAIRRGEKDGFLKVAIDAEPTSILPWIEHRFVKNPQTESGRFITKAVADAYERLIAPSAETDTRLMLKERADLEAITVFSKNLRQLLLAPPLGGKNVLGVDPGYRTGCKVAVIDATGKYLEDDVIYLHTSQSQAAAAKRIREFVMRHSIEYIAQGNGTASRETEAFLREVARELPHRVEIVVVNEAGASVYSASDLAREEFPELDVTVRGAISIARRLQDPLAELVKIDPKSIGVGQYQHDVNQALLKKSLEEVVESCVNFVGVDVNTASISLLSYVSGIGPKLAQAIVQHRDRVGSFRSREEILKVPRFGEKVYLQAAGFLRIRHGLHPLDNTAVHPESYGIVKIMAQKANSTVEELIRNETVVRNLKLEQFVDGAVGMPTLQDIVEELLKPGRDPRASFQRIEFREDVKEISDLKEGMILQGKVTNVTNFGAFVDIGVHQDGLVHVSELAHRFIRDPVEVVAVGDLVMVKVLSVDLARSRVALSLKAATPPPPPQRIGRG